MNFCWVVIFAELEVKDIEAKGDTNITLLCGLRFWQTWRRRWRRGLKLPKNVRCAPSATLEVQLAARKKNRKGKPSFGCHTAKDWQARNRSQSETQLCTQPAKFFWVYSSRESYEKKMLEVNATTGNSIVLTKKNIFMVLRWMSDRLRDTHDSFVAIGEKGLANEDANHLLKLINFIYKCHGKSYKYTIRMIVLF